MSNYLIYGVGFTAQLLFSLRLLIQWLKSEKVGKVVTPSVFWSFSLVASMLLFYYGYLRDDFAIMLGQFFIYYIYIRNLQLQEQWKKISIIIRRLILFFPFLFVVYYWSRMGSLNILFKNDRIPLSLLSLGIVSQLIFMSRFVFQWIYSEKIKQSTLPLGFWLLSITGSILVLLYGVMRKDPVLIIAHTIGLTIYFRNVVILRKQSD